MPLAHLHRIASASIALAAASVATTTSTAGLIEPWTTIIDSSLAKRQTEAQLLAARRYDTFWNGEEPPRSATCSHTYRGKP